MPELVGDLRSFLVQILYPLSDESEGTGFLCRPDGLVLTCWHVMKSWHQCKITEGKIRFDNQKYTAQWLVERSDEAADLAILKLTIPEVLELPYFLDVHWRVQATDSLVSFGYPEGPFKKGISIRPELQGLTPSHMEGWSAELYPIMGHNLDNIDKGYSGAPVINTRTQKVIGLVNSKQHETQAFIVPLAPLFVRWPELKEYHDIYRRIREQLAKDAQKKFDQQIKKTTFIPLRLEQGRVPKTPEERGEGDYGRRWQALDLEQLLPPPRDRQILVADVGAGKTTWLLWLAGTLVEKTRAVPLFLTCSELEESKVRHWADLQNELISRYEIQFMEKKILAVDLRDFLAQAFQDKCLVFLLDGLDQIKVPHYADLARTAFEIAGANAVLISARPSAVLALENDPNIIFLRLQSFSDEEERQYFGQYHDSAQKLLVLAPELTRVPMLAYMIRTLVKERLTAGVETRTEIYQQFVQHILSKHEPNALIYKEDWTLSDNLFKVLSTLAYRALTETQIQRIEAGLADRVLGEMRQTVSIEQLSTFGFVNRMLERSENRLLFFTHQSFQEFLAARYLAEDEHESERNKVMTERWNPKWEQVIQFLAGLKEEQILEALLEAPDNIIHANLFLAASCVPELKAINSTAIKRIEQGIVPLLEQVPLQKDALKAVSALGHVHTPLDPALAERLISSFDEESSSVIEEVVTALKALAEQLLPRQVDAIAALLSHVDSDVRRAAVEVLGGLGERLSSPQMDVVVARLSDEDFYMRRAAARALGSLGERLLPRQVDAIAALLSHVDSDVRRAAVEVLGHLIKRLSSPQVDALVARLSDEDGYVHRAAVEVLSRLIKRLSSPQVDAFVARLSDEDGYVRRAAVEVLGGLGERLSSTQVDSFIARLSDESWLVREAVVEVLVGLRKRLSSAQVDAIASLLSHVDSDVRRAAVEVLGGLRERLSSSQVDALVARLSDESLFVRRAAVEVLGRLIQRLNSAQVDVIAARLSDEDLYMRCATVEALGGLGDRLSSAQVDAIAALLSNENSDVREVAVKVLGELIEHLSSAQVDLIVALLSHVDPYVRRAALEMLGSLGERLLPRQVDALVARLSDEDGYVRRAAVEVLGGLGERLSSPQMDVVVARLSDEDFYMRRAAASALGSLGERLLPRQVDAIAALLNHMDSGVCSAAVEVLGSLRERLSSPQVDALVARLSDEDGYVRRAAVEAFRDLGVRLDDEQLNTIVTRLLDKHTGRSEEAYDLLKYLYHQGHPLPTLV